MKKSASKSARGCISGKGSASTWLSLISTVLSIRPDHWMNQTVKEALLCTGLCTQDCILSPLPSQPLPLFPSNLVPQTFPFPAIQNDVSNMKQKVNYSNNGRKMLLSSLHYTYWRLSTDCHPSSMQHPSETQKHKNIRSIDHHIISSGCNLNVNFHSNLPNNSNVPLVLHVVHYFQLLFLLYNHKYDRGNQVQSDYQISTDLWKGWWLTTTYNQGTTNSLDTFWTHFKQFSVDNLHYPRCVN